MRFHDKNNAVHLLIEGSSGKFELILEYPEVHGVGYFMESEFPRIRPAFRKSIQFISKPFWDAFLKAKEKLSAVLKNEPIRKSGTLIYSEANLGTLTTFYDLETRFDGKEMLVNGRIVVFANEERRPLPRLIFYAHLENNEGITFRSLATDGEDADDFITEVLTLILFIKYCPIETKIVAKGKKISHSHVDYLNKTGLPIEILDSTWFTTLVRSEGFTVNGHFRLQPVGPGRSERKLRWIAPYEKKGYVRKAKVLRNTDRRADEAGGAAP